MLRPLPLLVTSLVALAVAAPATAATIDLRVDANRDGAVSSADDAGEDAASLTGGALVLPNVDDDAGRCPGRWRRQLRHRLMMNELLGCSDAETPKVDGPRDAADLAPLEVAASPGLADGASATITLVSGAGRLHGAGQDGAEIHLDAAALRAGAALQVEATAVARTADTAVLRVEARLEGDGEPTTDAVALRIAPLVVPSGVADAQRLFAERTPTRRELAATLERLRKGLSSGSGKPSAKVRREIAGRQRYARAERRYLQGLPRALGGTVKLERLGLGYVWVQDRFEIAYATVPRAGGVQRMQVTMATYGRIEGGTISPRNEAIRQLMPVLRTFTGPGRGLVMPRLSSRETNEGPLDIEPFDPTGALEATPPLPGAPNGKLLLSDQGTERRGFADLLGAQAQPVVELPVRWLDVGHVDEVVSFVPAATGRGWALVLADPAGALRLARGRVPGRVRTATQTAATRMRELEPLLRRELGLPTTGDEALIRVPVLFAPATGPLAHGLTAWTGDAVNGLHVRGHRFLAPTPHGPRVRGRDAFAQATRRAFADKGVAVRFVETSPAPHKGEGELHCTTNALRPLAQERWWLDARPGGEVKSRVSAQGAEPAA